MRRPGSGPTARRRRTRHHADREEHLDGQQVAQQVGAGGRVPPPHVRPRGLEVALGRQLHQEYALQHLLVHDDVRA
eukprot:8814988-Alexandrium_andersonii.AAC.1